MHYHKKEYFYFMVFLFIIAVGIYILHELSHILFQIIFNTPININIDNMGLHTSNNLDLLLKLPAYQFTLVYGAGLITPILLLFFKRFNKLILKFPSKILREHKILFYVSYIIFVFIFAIIDLKSIYTYWTLLLQ